MAAGSHTIEFLGLDTAGGDNTAFLDDVTVATGQPSHHAQRPDDRATRASSQVQVGAGNYAVRPHRLALDVLRAARG